VWEWVQDYYDYYYTITPYANPVLTVSMQDPNIPYFSVRGGCFRHAWWYLRTSHRREDIGATPSLKDQMTSRFSVAASMVPVRTIDFG
jgi:formylglycine-generating enzyme required for sulfatase activity